MDWPAAVYGALSEVLRQGAVPCLRSVKRDGDGDCLYEYARLDIGRQRQSDNEIYRGSAIVRERANGYWLGFVTPGIYDAASTSKDLDWSVFQASLAVSCASPSAMFFLTGSRLGVCAEAALPKDINTGQLKFVAHECLHRVIRDHLKWAVVVDAVQVVGPLAASVIAAALSEAVSRMVGPNPLLEGGGASGGADRL